MVKLQMYVLQDTPPSYGSTKILDSGFFHFKNNFYLQFIYNQIDIWLLKYCTKYDVIHFKHASILALWPYFSIR